ncbi:MAG: hypothetical protein ACOCYG_04050 [Spirochaetota bacterium]
MTREEALRQLDEIHRQVARSTHFRGYRPLYLVVVGAIAAAFAVAQFLAPHFQDLTLEEAATAWLVLGAVVAAAVGLGVFLPSFLSKDRLVRELATNVLGQFLPALALAAALGIAAVLRFPTVLPLFPTIMAGLFGLGITAMAPFLPDRVGLSALWYLACALAFALLVPEGGSHISSGTALGLRMGIAFGIGHVLTAVLFLIGDDRNGGRGSDRDGEGAAATTEGRDQTGPGGRPRPRRSEGTQDG